LSERRIPSANVEHLSERIARNEQRLDELRGDMADRKQEETRTRDRLHKLEGAVGLLVDNMKTARHREELQYRRLEVRIQQLTLAVAVAAILVSLVVAFVPHS
jgi:hypothetical protein